MNIMDERLINACIRFSQTFRVTPPWNNDLGDWWDRAVFELDEDDCIFLYKVLKHSLGFKTTDKKIIHLMLETLEKRNIDYENQIQVILNQAVFH